MRPWRGVILQDKVVSLPAGGQGMVGVEYVVSPDDPVVLTFTTHTVSIEGNVFSWIALRLRDYIEEAK
jgi:hypothetical protein